MSEKDAPKTQAGHGKRGSAKWDDTMFKARNQADGYARAVSKEDGWPPFLLVVDVGNVIEVHADFSRQGQGYTQFPDGNSYRIKLEDLHDADTRERLATIWNDPYSLDPSLKSAKVTREIASHLAELGKSFEGQGHESKAVAEYLMRCLFTMFAEDVELIPMHSFRDKLVELRGKPEHAAPTLKSLWETMDRGGFSPVLTTDLKRFNGGLFKNSDALPLNALQLGLLIEAASADWKQVEPAIFGTLLERALDKKQRHKLGAHYTPRAYVERLVTPTIMEPLRDDWRDVQAGVQRLTEDGKTGEALKLVRDFHHKLCDIRVLDPACGSGNFRYVAMEMMKRLEGEVTALMVDLGDTKPLITVDPHQFLGIELNPWAANVAELVLWIGYLQWHFRTYGTAAPSEPVLRDFHNIEHRDAVLEWDDRTPRVDEDGKPVTRWDGVTTTRHPVTGEEVPDPDARVHVFDYTKPRATVWPQADFITGNPPFIGLRNLRRAYADGYVEALRAAYPKIPENANYVMYWWEKAASRAAAWNPSSKKGARRFGLITTNAINQSFNRAVTQRFLSDGKSPLSILFAVPDHPWVDASDGAAVRIAMTVCAYGSRNGLLRQVVSETSGRSGEDGARIEFENKNGQILADLRVGADNLSAKPLKSNTGLASVGFQINGKGFIIEPETRKKWIEENPNTSSLLKHWLNGMGLQRQRPAMYAIDLWPYSEDEVKREFPTIYQHVLDFVWPERRENARRAVRERWWLFEECRNTFRPAIQHINRVIVTTLTSANRVFSLVDAQTVADSTTVMFAFEDSWYLSILSSRLHTTWFEANAASLGKFVGNIRYNKTRCFDPFPFPDLSEDQITRLRTLGEELDTHRKRQQAAHPKLTLTQMYKVLEKLRAGETIEGKDREIYDQGLIGILKDLHHQIDAEVARAYGWPVDLSDEDILFRLVALNKERAEEEARGHIRWLRPDYQNPDGKTAVKGKTTEMDLGVAAKTAKEPWPKTLPDQIAAVREALEDMGEASPEQIARRFARARTATVQPLLQSLAALGQAEITEDGRYAA